MAEFKVNYWRGVESDALLVVEISGMCELCQINLQQCTSFSVGAKGLTSRVTVLAVNTFPALTYLGGGAA